MNQTSLLPACPSVSTPTKTTLQVHANDTLGRNVSVSYLKQQPVVIVRAQLD